LSNESMGSVNCVRIGWGRRTVEGSLFESATDGDIWESRVGEEKLTNGREGKWALDIKGQRGAWNFRLKQ
jgi:hypothetical protein